ncbi:MAG: tail fiber protein [Bacteroidetes bacterium]|nr:MAG: tail fiber protein [Bacteroidota bacterium]
MRIGSVPFSFRAGKSDTASYSENSKMSLHALSSDSSGYSQRADTAAYAMSGVLPVGVILPFGGIAAKIPDGWMLCDGTALSSKDYPHLYQVISTNWGDGSNDTTGTKNFNLPDLRGLFLRGVDGGAGRDADAGFRQPIKPGGNAGDNVGSLQDMSGANSNPLYISSDKSGVEPMYDNQGYRYSTSSESVEETSAVPMPPNGSVFYIIKVR